MKRKMIAIVGGMGPAAGEYLHKLLLSEMCATLNIQKDQEYLDIIHYSLGSEIPDRTAFLEGKSNLNPAFPVFKIFQQLEGMARSFNRHIITCIACNTFFAAPILSEFDALWKDYPLSLVRYLNLIEHTIGFVQTHLQPADLIGLLSTNGGRKLKVYQAPLEQKGFKVLQVSSEQQEQLNWAIYQVKCNPSYSYKAHKVILKAIDHLLSQGAKSVLLGCTEISLVANEHNLNSSKLIDPLKIITQDTLIEALINPLHELTHNDTVSS